ncbi:hypothetical protein CHUAL_009632 [Chamberlinius hualienensis]
MERVHNEPRELMLHTTGKWTQQEDGPTVVGQVSAQEWEDGDSLVTRRKELEVGVLVSTPVQGTNSVHCCAGNDKDVPGVEGC